MKLINFDELFNDYFTEWYAKNASKYANEDQIESAVGQLYQNWAKQKNKALNNASPKEFFSKLNAMEKVEMVIAYLNSDIPLCDLLCEEIATDKSTENAIFQALKNAKSDEQKGIYINLLKDMDSNIANLFLAELVFSKNETDEIKDVALDFLASSPEIANSVVDTLLQKVKKGDYKVKEMIADVCASAKGNKNALNFLTSMLKSGEDVALFASYLGKLGDDQALPALQDEIKRDNINYVEFVELRNAIESMGGVVEEQKVFEDDPLYQKIKNASQKKEEN